MLYPIYVHKDEGSAYGASFPDFPGCFTAADDIADLPKSAQEAAEAHYPSAPDAWFNDPDYQGGFWMMVDIDLGKVRPKAVRINISLPENLLPRIDAYAKAHGTSRSSFLAKAAERGMESA